MTKHPASALGDHADFLPELPLAGESWRMIFGHLRLSPRQIEITRLMLRSASNLQIAQVLGVSEGTVKTQVQRIFNRASVHDRMEFAMRVLALSHELADGRPCHPVG
ncbi:MAG TPA: LuxR C-terminal-related transcriptional regulator [Pirellulales bacterium]|jgi:DNA-binding NarL/FixJ family response regulator